jgi:DNA-binding NarL/FixJ family response regulator
VTMAVALVIARPAHLRESLTVLLQALPRLKRVEQATDIDSALIFSVGLEPDLVLLDCDLPHSEAQSGLAQIKARWPHARCLVLLDDEPANQEACTGGADGIVVKGIHPAQLLKVAETLICMVDGQEHRGDTTGGMD